jgi:hypothetical protein
MPSTPAGIPTGPSDNGGATPVEDSAYSRIFYGDGRRLWRDSGLSAGEPWLISADPDGTGSSETGLNHLSDSFFSMVDLGRSGRPALIQYAGPGAAIGGGDDATDIFGETEDEGVRVHAGYDWGVRYGFFEPSGDPWPADVDLGVSGLGGRYPHERQVILADFDGDGFVDQLRLFTERDSAARSRLQQRRELQRHLPRPHPRDDPGPHDRGGGPLGRHHRA